VEPKDSQPDRPVKPIVSPSGLDLHPAPKQPVRLNRRAGLAVAAVGLLLLIAFAYGGYQRQLRVQLEARGGRLIKNVEPATTAGAEFTKDLPVGRATARNETSHQLQPPGSSVGYSASPFCGNDPRTGEPFHFDPQTGRPCPAYTGVPQDRVVVRQGAYRGGPAVPAAVPEPSPEERRLILAYQREQEARFAPTGISTASGPGFQGAGGLGFATLDSPDRLRAAPIRRWEEAAGQNPAASRFNAVRLQRTSQMMLTRICKVGKKRFLPPQGVGRPMTTFDRREHRRCLLTKSRPAGRFRLFLSRA